ncbi:MAG TPA: phosphoribosylanthranilate isomerase [Vicinamibacterales bacterium]|nr:phosphoribosylanthranilate isomerase [Vicinamibacterales bacterium]
MKGRDLFVKVCGITRLQDADQAADHGASAIGFIFWPGSPRYISPEDARAIVRRKAAGLKTVGVFVDEAVERVQQIAEVVGLDLVQLHGNETAADVRAAQLKLRPGGNPRASVGRGFSRAVEVIKAVALNGSAPVDLSGFDDDVLILLDAHDPARHGGTGRTIDWAAARDVASARRTILAGGLTPDNVGAAVVAVEPYGVDVSSGVESAPGVKDATRLKRFFEALND